MQDDAIRIDEGGYQGVNLHQVDSVDDVGQLGDGFDVHFFDCHRHFVIAYDECFLQRLSDRLAVRSRRRRRDQSPIVYQQQKNKIGSIPLKFLTSAASGQKNGQSDQ
jgi:hypothetical protein